MDILPFGLLSEKDFETYFEITPSNTETFSFPFSRINSYVIHEWYEITSKADVPNPFDPPVYFQQHPVFYEYWSVDGNLDIPAIEERCDLEPILDFVLLLRSLGRI